MDCYISSDNYNCTSIESNSTDGGKVAYFTGMCHYYGFHVG